ncbi:MAG: hypothetical protein H7327_06115 [Herminiimonas sp.]|nr:hypothetical protein [Herminiimonas sp.]
MLPDVNRHRRAAAAGAQQPEPEPQAAALVVQDQPERRRPSGMPASPRTSPAPCAPRRVSILGFASDLPLMHELKKPDPPHPSRITGHVGYSLDGGKSIFGFGPHAPPGMDRDVVIDKLSRGDTFPGKITDDTHLFRSVHDNRWIPGSTVTQIVYKQDIDVSNAQFEAIRNKHDACGIDKAMPEVQYRFPFATTSPVVFNCATFPLHLNIPIPFARGILSEYIPALEKVGEEWTPDH